MRENRYFEKEHLSSKKKKDIPYSNTKNSNLVASLLSFLINLLSGRSLETDTKALDYVCQNENRQSLITNTELLIEKTFKQIKDNSKEFKLVSKTPNKIIYADPKDHLNIDKQITYNWNPSNDSWQIEPGKFANAIIPNEKNKSIITIKNGRTTSYQRQNNINTQSLQLRLDKQNLKLLQENLKQHELYSFDINNQKEFTDLKHEKNQFQIQKCKAGRAKILADIMTRFKNNAHFSIPGTLSYKDKKGDFYYWLSSSNDSYIGIKILANKQLQIIVCKSQNINNMLFMIAHNDLDKEGFAGGELAFFNEKDQNLELTKNSDYNQPNFKNKIIYISETELEAHLQNAKLAAREFLNNREFTANILENKNTESKTFVEKLSENKNTSETKFSKTRKAEFSLPNNIKVTSLNNEPIFELHCPSFREENCFDNVGGTYPANVYVLKKIGSNINIDKSNALIIEIADNSDVRLRSGYCGNKAVQAKITVNKNGEDYIATLDVNDEGEVVQSFDSEEDSPFKDTVMSKFMCVRACCSHYKKENQRLIEDPSRATAIQR